MIVAAMMMQTGPIDIPAAMARYRALTSVAATEDEDDCERRQAASDDIIVCATKASNQRLPLPDERGPPDRYIATGEPRQDPGRPGEPAKGSLLSTPIILFKVLQKVIDPDR